MVLHTLAPGLCGQEGSQALELSENITPKKFQQADQAKHHLSSLLLRQEAAGLLRSVHNI